MTQNICNFDPTQLTAGRMDKTAHGGSFAYLNLGNSRDRIRLQVGEVSPAGFVPVRAIFGVSPPYEGSADTGRYNMEICDLSEEAIAKIKLTDTCIKKLAKEQSVDWFGKQLSEESIEDRFMSPLREAEGKSTTLRVKVSKDAAKTNVVSARKEEGKWMCVPMPLDGIQPQARMVVVFGLGSVWFMASGKQFGYSINASNLMVEEGSHQRAGSGIESFLVIDGVSLHHEKVEGSTGFDAPEIVDDFMQQDV